MTKIKESQKRQRELDLKENGFWKEVISNYLENNEDPVEMLNYDQWVNDITADDIKKAINEYLGENIVKVVLYPETKK